MGSKAAGAGRFLAAIADDIALLPHSDRATLWDVFEKEPGLMGLRNAKTHKWLGSTFYGAIRVSGNYFGRQEECHVPDLELAAPDYAGAGAGAGAGVGVGRAGKAAGGSAARSVPVPVPSHGVLILSKNGGRGGWLKLEGCAEGAGGGWGAGAGAGVELVRTVTGSVSDKQGSVLFRPVFVRVQRNPAEDEE